MIWGKVFINYAVPHEDMKDVYKGKDQKMNCGKIGWLHVIFIIHLSLHLSYIQFKSVDVFK